MTYVLAAGGAIYLYLLYAWLLSAIISAELARSKVYDERKPWQRRHKPREAEMSGEAAGEHGETAISK